MCTTCAVQHDEISALYPDKVATLRSRIAYWNSSELSAGEVGRGALISDETLASLQRCTVQTVALLIPQPAMRPLTRGRGSGGHLWLSLLPMPVDITL